MEARERLVSVRSKAIDKLEQMLEQLDPSDTNNVRAIQVVLDRTGFGPNVKITDERKPDDRDFAQMVEEAKARLIRERENPLQPKEIEGVATIHSLD